MNVPESTVPTYSPRYKKSSTPRKPSKKQSRLSKKKIKKSHKHRKSIKKALKTGPRKIFK
jgi:hypothetical protein